MCLNMLGMVPVRKGPSIPNNAGDFSGNQEAFATEHLNILAGVLILRTLKFKCLHLNDSLVS